MKTTITIEDKIEHEILLKSDVICDSEYNGEEIDWDNPPLGPKLGWIIQFLIEQPATLEQIWITVKQISDENSKPKLSVVKSD